MVQYYIETNHMIRVIKVLLTRTVIDDKYEDTNQYCNRHANNKFSFFYHDIPVEMLHN